MKLKAYLPIVQEAAEKLYKLKNSNLSLSRAASVYSFEEGEKGNPKDIFGNNGHDGGYFLSISEKETDKVRFPIIRLDLISNRGRIYSSTASWYAMMFIFSNDAWAKSDRERASRPKLGNWPDVDSFSTPSSP